MEIWCCEAQERYVCVVSANLMNEFKKIAQHERCSFRIVGTATKEKHLTLTDRDSTTFPKPIDTPMSLLFAKPPKMSRIVDSRELKLARFDTSLTSYLPKTPTENILQEAIDRVLTLPSVGSKSFLITIGDRTVGGMTARDQMVGPWQVPVADVSVTATSLMAGVKTGEAMAMGEKPTLAFASPAASARMAVAESLMNLAAADCLDSLPRVKLSANWMAASSHPGEGAALYEAVEAIGMDLCPELKVSIPVGKDSMSMKMRWNDTESKEEKAVTAPLSLVITAFAPVRNISRTWTPTLRRPEEVGETLLMFVDLAEGKKAMGGSALAQCFGQTGQQVPDIRDVDFFRDYFDAIEQLHASGIVLAYHDQSDGGLFTTLAEMMFAGRCGLEVMLDELAPTAGTSDLIEALFNEELGAVFQIRKNDFEKFKGCFSTSGATNKVLKKIARVPNSKKSQNLTLMHGVTQIYTATRASLQQKWASTSFALQHLRDDPICADEEYANILDDADPGLSFNLKFKPADKILPGGLSGMFSSALPAALTSKPRVAILREQGTNGHAEMAFAFSVAGFSPIDVHMTDIDSGRVSLASFVGLAACGGFSYGDVLGAGRGWAMSVLLKPNLRKEFQNFFQRANTFTLGVCNGCQFLSRLKEIIPGAENWPTFEFNRSEQYEARVCMVAMDEPTELIRSKKVEPSVFLHGMHGSTLPIVTAHAEGQATFDTSSANAPTAQTLLDQGLVALRYLDNRLQPTERYPYNPNGSPLGIAGVRTPDGRVLSMMPHPERTIIKDVGSYLPEEREAWGESGPWVRVFRSARRWVG
jgi:phosphoribosylformylglycinamidine synthase